MKENTRKNDENTQKIFAVNLNSQGEKLKDHGWAKIHK